MGYCIVVVDVLVFFFIDFFSPLSRFDSLVSVVSDPVVQIKTTLCLEHLQCKIDSKTFLSAYILVCFPSRVACSSVAVFEASNLLLGAFEVLCAMGCAYTEDRHASLVSAASVFAESFEEWKKDCMERFGFWIEMCDALRLVLDYVLWNKKSCT